MSKRKRKAKRSKRAKCCQEIDDCLEPQFFKALGDPNRVKLLVGLARCGEPRTVSELNACCPIDVSVVSRHLATLHNAGIIDAEKRGKEVYYAVCSCDVVSMLRNLADAIEECCPAEEQDGTNPPKGKRQ